MDADPNRLFPGTAALPGHARLIGALRRSVERDDRWRWLELGCSLASGRGDELSDIDVAVGHHLQVAPLDSAGLELVSELGQTSDVLVHALDGWPDDVVRVAAEFDTGIQLDLVLMPSHQRPGLPEGAIALVDKDDRLSSNWVPPVATTDWRTARGWAMLGWWELSNVAKYLQRDALFEAVEALGKARAEALRLFAVANGVPYPAFGLTSLLDFEPFDLPVGLASTYATPDDAVGVHQAALTVADLIDTQTTEAGRVLGEAISSPWASIARERLM